MEIRKHSTYQIFLFLFVSFSFSFFFFSTTKKIELVTQSYKSLIAGLLRNFYGTPQNNRKPTFATLFLSLFSLHFAFVCLALPIVFHVVKRKLERQSFVMLLALSVEFSKIGSRANFWLNKLSRVSENNTISICDNYFFSFCSV